MRRILITGGAGNVGGSLARRLVENPNNFVIIIDNLLTGSVNKLPDKKYNNWAFIEANVNNLNEVLPILKSESLDYVFHYAALVGVKRTLANPIAVLKDIDGVKNILQISRDLNVNRVFLSSSSEVYGEPVEIPQNEITTPLNAKLPYAIVKNISESYCRSYHQMFGLDYTIFRFFNTYGPLQSDDFVLTKFIESAVLGKDLEVYGDGSQTRTFCFIEDNLKATIESMEKDYWINDVVNIGNDNEISIVELANIVIRTLNSKSSIKFVKPLAEGDMTRRKPDISKMKSFFTGSFTSLKEGIMLTHEGLISNKSNSL